MSQMRRLVLVAMMATAGVVAAAPAVAQAAAEPSANPAGMQRLSDERLLTRWAYPGTRAPIYTRPTGQARKITRLRWLTEDKLPELYVVLAEWSDARGNTWSKIRVPARPNGQTGWVRRGALREYNTIHTQLEIDKSALRATLYNNGKKIWSARVGVGAPGTPTPSGRFYVREKFRVSGAPVYGPYALGTSAYAPYLTDWPGGGVVGLHGTNQPALIPGRPSHGCIRIRNDKIGQLYRLTPRGTPIWIHS